MKSGFSPYEKIQIEELLNRIADGRVSRFVFENNKKSTEESLNYYKKTGDTEYIKRLGRSLAAYEYVAKKAKWIKCTKNGA